MYRLTTLLGVFCFMLASTSAFAQSNSTVVTQVLNR